MDEENTNNLVAILDYATAADYVTYNSDDIGTNGGTTFVGGKLLDQSPTAIEGSFVTIKGKPVEISEIMEKGEYHVIYLDFAATVTVNGPVKYISTNVSCLTKNTVTTQAGTGIFYHIQVILSDKQESPGAHGRSRLHTERLGERKVGI